MTFRSVGKDKKGFVLLSSKKPMCYESMLYSEIYVIIDNIMQGVKERNITNISPPNKLYTKYTEINSTLKSQDCHWCNSMVRRRLLLKSKYKHAGDYKGILTKTRKLYISKHDKKEKEGIMW